MKLLTLKTFVLAGVITIASCKKSYPHELQNLTKISLKELIERARIKSFIDINKITYITEKEKKISRHVFINMKNFEELAFYDYADKSGTVRVTIIRTENQKDKEVRERELIKRLMKIQL